ncbi:diaminopropionate ammonia-lyase [Haliea sp. E1-2-M8]|uniref:diaminopropionate ammonia-lyase n=1 Tax=Haliea sp. E1-2-M8 TaxID=3064706 RepID=UPI00271BA2F1|nr:diaminopropionate ammonia-lyase [Haliea sp. E1-2-M8]MDO8864023.1 diaminopropionate ammonia-lyase [Haliea sp. E1-2-M8]
MFENATIDLGHGARLVRNVSGPCQEPERIIGADQGADARMQIRTWPSYEPTQLRSLTDLANQLGIAQLLVKDEGSRMGLGSFKSVGGAYAVVELVRRYLEALTQRVVNTAEIFSGEFRNLLADKVIVSATAGNHGKAVAFGARMCGCQCRIFVHGGVTDDRVQAIEALGADVIVVEGSYDDSVREAAEQALRHDWWVVADTAYDGYTKVPVDIMRGYTLIMDEVIEQLKGEALPTHILVQTGVGSLAAALCAFLQARLGEDRPRFIVVESVKAACLQESFLCGHSTIVSGPHATSMLGLAAGEASALAWPALRTGATAFVTITDGDSAQARHLLAIAHPPVSSGPSGAAGLAGLLRILSSETASQSLNINQHSRILVISTEEDVEALAQPSKTAG